MINKLLDEKNPDSMSPSCERELLSFLKKEGYTIVYIKKDQSNDDGLKKMIYIELHKGGKQLSSTYWAKCRDHSLKDHFEKLRASAYRNFFRYYKMKYDPSLDTMWARLKRKKRIK